MSRFVLYAFCGMLFLRSEVNSPLRAADLMDSSDAPLLQFVTSNAFENHQLELGRPNPETIWFSEDEPSPLFTGPSENDASEWDYLWRNASRTPITSIPEPTTSSLLIGGAILLCLRRMRRTRA
jgi:hypothetical protein